MDFVRHLPVDAVQQIFSRLPVRTLVQFRTVSRPWRASIDDPDFHRFHLTRFNAIAGESRLFIAHVPTRYTSHCTVVRTETFEFLDSPSIRRQRGLVRDWEVIGSVDGLFMVRQTAATRRLMLWNPSTQRSLPLPPSPVLPRVLWRYDDMGLGFDPVNRDYRHVRFAFGFAHLAVYSLATDSWRTIGFDQRPVRRDWIPDWQNRVCLNGVLYVLALIDDFTRPLCLVSFDLATDECLLWDDVPVVDAHLVGDYTEQVLTTADGGSSLAMFNFSAAEGTMWVLQQDIPSARRWARRYVFPMGFLMDFLYLTRNDEMVVKTFGGIIAYNLATRQIRILFRGRCHRCKAWQYKENLIRF